MRTALSATIDRPTGGGLWAAESVPPPVFARIRRRAMLEGCKWDPQVGDTAALAPFPLVLSMTAWNDLAAQAERLTAEAVAAEEEISHRPELLACLGFPAGFRRVLTRPGTFTIGTDRVMRFDFHSTTEGWRISEANSDVPGGFTEASHFTALMAAEFPAFHMAGDPAAAWSEALARSAGPGGLVALLSAPGFMEDQQVTAFLAKKLHAAGCRTVLAKPEQIRWRGRRAEMSTAWHEGAVDLIVRFYQAEWLARLGRRCDWESYFRGGKTPVANPPRAVIAESKRFPLVWDSLSVELPTWRALLPETRDPRDAPWTREDGWLLKTALCNTGDTVSHPEWLRPRDWLQVSLAARLFPSRWVAQRRFESVPVRTPHGLRHACIGIYTVNGRAAGAYTRITEKPVIDFSASDVALLLNNDDRD